MKRKKLLVVGSIPDESNLLNYGGATVLMKNYLDYLASQSEMNIGLYKTTGIQIFALASVVCGAIIHTFSRHFCGDCLGAIL